MAPGEKVGCAKIEMEACMPAREPCKERSKTSWSPARSDALPDAPGGGCIPGLRHRAERVGAKRGDAFADLSFISATAISTGYNSAGCATRSRDPLRLLP